ncbi:MAG: transposase [Pseudanabaenales cyanobacterium]|nr:transposase [Pseudanabaenales cyanobacterium]
MLTRRTTFRLYPTPSQEAKLYEWRRLHCYLYNAAIADRRDMYKRWGISLTYYDQQNILPAFKEEWPEFVELGSQALQATLKRVDLAYQSFFKGLRGYPKFKSIRQYSGWTYPALAGWKALSDGENGKLRLSNLGEIQMRGKARTWGQPSTCTIINRNGKWYASITVKCNPTRETGEGAIGVDLGCQDAITLSTGEKVAKPDFILENQRQVKRAEKAKRRKRSPNRSKGIKGSNRWKRAQRKVSRLKRKVARQREDWAHKVTSNIVSGNSLVVGEKLNIKGMTRKARKGKRRRQKAGLNRSILDVGMAKISTMLDYKEAEAGGFYLESPTLKLKPTQRCHECWELTPNLLSDRVHNCQHCSCVEDRDVNAAKVNLRWGLGTDLHTAKRGSQASTPTATGGWKQVWEGKRQKPSVA